MLNTELINLHSIMSAAISPVISSASTLSKVIALKAFTEYKNLVLETPDLAKGSHVTMNIPKPYRFINKLLHPGQIL